MNSKVFNAATKEVETVPIPQEELEELQASSLPQLERDIRDRRNEILSSCDWTQLKDAPLSTEEVEVWAIYRQALRDIPQQSGFPSEVIWPISP